MPHPTAIILVVGLNPSLIGDDCPRISAFVKSGHLRRLKPVLPAVTTTVQSSMLTGLLPSQHGIVANGWYSREMAEVQFWKQSNALVQGEKVWETARKRDASVTTLNMFWWYNMYSSANWSVTPRPMYKADGRKIPDCYSHPPELRDELQAELGPFPLFHFWGPGSSIRSSKWIADATKIVHAKKKPTLTLLYLPHLDYALQQHGDDANVGTSRAGTHAGSALAEIDGVVGGLLDYFAQRGSRVMLVSEYGIENVDDSIHINRHLREAGWLRVREEQGLEILDAGASEAFAVADHQVAHVYASRGLPTMSRLAALCRSIPGVEQVLDKHDQVAAGIAHERSGDLVLVAEPRKWFSYDYWLDGAKAPDFARTVDIHRKPGYDPLELFIDPKIKLPKLKLAWRLFQRKLLHQRALLDIIPLDTKLVRGSHGRVEQPPGMMPVIVSQRALPEQEVLPCTLVRDLILESLFEE
jgi:predicted AlkP superfamily pyrophosphatase or phosphodiesterase